MLKLKGIFEKSGWFAKLLMLAGFSVFFASFSLVVWTAINGAGDDSTASLKALQLVQSVGLFVVPPLVFAFFCSAHPAKFLRLGREIRLRDVFGLIVFMVLIVPGINLLSTLNQQMTLPPVLAGLENWMKTSEQLAARLTTQMLEVRGFWALSFNIFLMAIVPALGEELFFRGSVQGVLREKFSPVVAIWVAAALFSAVHMQFYGFLPRLLLGAFFGYLVVWSGNIWLAVIAHFVNNAVAVVFYYLKFNGSTLPDIDKVGVGHSLWVGIFSLVLAIAGFLYFKRRVRTR